MKNAWARLFRAKDGASAVEFSIVAWPFLLVVIGVLEFGRALWTREALQEAAMAGARCMGVLQSNCATGGSYDPTKTKSYVRSIASGWSVALPVADISSTNGVSCGGVPGFSRVTINYAFQTVAPGVMRALSGGVTLSTSACFPNQS
jgi:Flp pilus assembly protein TadG